MKDYLSTNGAYSIRLARDEEVKQVLGLRYDIFTLELQEGSKNVYKQDFDSFDKYCDFLVLVHNKTKEIIGLYRILPFFKVDSSFGYYSGTEFEIGGLPKEKIAELGRLCIKKEHRGKGCLDLLWLGLCKYAKENKIRYYFGCGSLKANTSLEEMRQMYWYLQNKRKMSKKYEAIPLVPSMVKERILSVDKHKDASEIMDVDESIMGVGEKRKVKRKEFSRLCPRLIKRYLRVGTKILGKPAFDPYFKCYDFLIMIDFKESRIKILNYFLNTKRFSKRIVHKVFGKAISKRNEKKLLKKNK